MRSRPTLRTLFDPTALGSAAHLDALDELRGGGDVVELDAGGASARRTFVALSHDAVVGAGTHVATSARFGTGVVDAVDADPDNGVAHRALNTSDGATHAALRALVAPTFIFDDVARASTQAKARAAWGAASRARAVDALEVVGDVIVAVLAARLGVADETLVEVRALTRRAAFALHDAGDRAAARRTLLDVDQLLTTLGAEALVTADIDDADGEHRSLVARVRAAVADRTLAPTDAAWLLRLSFLTAFTTTELAGAHALAVLADDASLRATLTLRPGLRGRFVSEALRVQAPVARFGRVARDDVLVDDVVVPRGARLLLSFCGAAHDPRRFACPRTIDLERPPTGSVVFGVGPHACVGAAVASTIVGAVVDAALAGPPFAVDGREQLVSDVNRGWRRARLLFSPASR